MTELSALPVVVPLLAAPLLIVSGAFAPRWFEDGLAGLSALAVVTLCVLLAVHAGHEPFAYWLGGWRPRYGVAIGISLSIDPLGAGMAAFAALLVLAALAYSWRYFDAVKGLFHALMLLFMVGMVGFCLTGDLFNLIVFIELMSAAAYALTAYRIEERAPSRGRSTSRSPTASRRTRFSSASRCSTRGRARSTWRRSARRSTATAPIRS